MDKNHKFLHIDAEELEMAIAQLQQSHQDVQQKSQISNHFKQNKNNYISNRLVNSSLHMPNFLTNQ